MAAILDWAVRPPGGMWTLVNQVLEFFHVISSWLTYQNVFHTMHNNHTHQFIRYPFSIHFRWFGRPYWILHKNRQCDTSENCIIEFLDPNYILFDIFHANIWWLYHQPAASHILIWRPSWIEPYGHQGVCAPPWIRFSETSYPYLSPCKSPEKVQPVQNCYGFASS